MNPRPGPPSSSIVACSCDLIVLVYTRAHKWWRQMSTSTEAAETPNEASGSGGGDAGGRRGDDGTTTTEPSKRTKGKGTSSKGTPPPSTLCANCGSEGSQRCGGCGQVHYCRNNMIMKKGKLINGCQQVW